MSGGAGAARPSKRAAQQTPRRSMPAADEIGSPHCGQPTTAGSCFVLTIAQETSVAFGIDARAVPVGLHDRSPVQPHDDVRRTPHHGSINADRETPRC